MYSTQCPEIRFLVQKLDLAKKWNWIFLAKIMIFTAKLRFFGHQKLIFFMTFLCNLLKSGSWQMKLLWKWGHFPDLFFDQFFPPIITLNIDSWTLLLTHGFPFQTHNSSPTNSFMVVYYISQTWKLGNPKAFFYPSQILQSC